MPQRLSYEDSCRALQSQQIIDEGDIPPLPQQPPRHDDEALGVGFFRTLLADVGLERLTLPRTFFGRCEIRNVSFQNTDLSESTANWNDFIRVDFSYADLSSCDLRACAFQNVDFSGTILNEVDFRHSSFENCNFDGANLSGAKLTKNAASSFQLSTEQQSAINWQEEDGDEPGGG